jgi:hypothetical protein
MVGGLHCCTGLKFCTYQIGTGIKYTSGTGTGTDIAGACLWENSQPFKYHGDINNSLNQKFKFKNLIIPPHVGYNWSKN